MKKKAKLLSLAMIVVMFCIIECATDYMLVGARDKEGQRICEIEDLKTSGFQRSVVDESYDVASTTITLDNGGQLNRICEVEDFQALGINRGVIDSYGYYCDFIGGNVTRYQSEGFDWPTTERWSAGGVGWDDLDCLTPEYPISLHKVTDYEFGINSDLKFVEVGEGWFGIRNDSSANYDKRYWLEVANQLENAPLQLGTCTGDLTLEEIPKDEKNHFAFYLHSYQLSDSVQDIVNVYIMNRASGMWLGLKGTDIVQSTQPYIWTLVF